MYFELTSNDQIAPYEEILGQLADFLEDNVRFSMVAFKDIEKATYPEHKNYHSTILGLMRHIIEKTDGISILVRKGSVENCWPLLRSAYEARASIIFILKADTEKRALAYQLAHAHKKIRFYRQFLPHDDIGKNTRGELKNDPLIKLLDQPRIDWQTKIDGLKKMFTRPEFVPIQAEWELVKKGPYGKGKKDPHWYSLFGGHQDMRSISKDIERGLYYDIFYRIWSDHIHAGSAMSMFTQNSQGQTIMKPVRSPAGIEEVCSHAWQHCFGTVIATIERFAPLELQYFRNKYVKELRQKAMELASKQILNIQGISY